MTNKDTKEKLLNQINIKEIVEDTVYAICYLCDLPEETMKEIVDSLNERYDIEETYFQTFKQVLGRNDVISRYIELQEKALEAQDVYSQFIEKAIYEKVSDHIPEELKIAQSLH